MKVFLLESNDNFWNNLFENEFLKYKDILKLSIFVHHLRLQMSIQLVLMFSISSKIPPNH
jgi:hypothetical protein